MLFIYIRKEELTEDKITDNFAMKIINGKSISAKSPLVT
jgi:hypothetical protein